MTSATWQPPGRMPSHAELHPLPLDVAALVRAGHLHQVEPGVYRRAPRPTTIIQTTHRDIRSPRPMSLSDAAKMDLLAIDALARHTIMPAREHVIMVDNGDEVRLVDRRDGRLLARADVSE